MNRPPHFEAEVHFLSAEEGGRKTPCISGYRPTIRYSDDGLWSAEQNFIGKDSINPGEDVTSQMALLEPGYHVGRLVVGTEFTLTEGAKVVARGIVTKTFPALDDATPIPVPEPERQSLARTILNWLLPGKTR